MKLGFDIGATNMRLAVITSEGIGAIRHSATPADPSAAVKILALFARELAGGVPELLTGGIAAIIEDGVIAFSTNLPTWKGYDFRAALSESTGAPVLVANDAELAALGEATYGAGRGKELVAYIGIGTGVGTGLVRHGTVQPHSSDGIDRVTIITLSDGSTLETRIGGRALYERYGKLAETLARGVWDELTPLLAEGIGNAVRMWSPDIVVLGGSLMNEQNGFRIEEVERALPAHLPVRIEHSLFGDAAGLQGARALAGL
ncbi:MAG: putative glucokinase [Parcubacteria group bacterium]|nr:putative glucokinase [Parcubacteria group bacterium]